MVRLAKSSRDMPRSSVIMERLTSRAIMMSKPLASTSLRRVPILGASIPMAMKATAVRHRANFHTDRRGRAWGHKVLTKARSTELAVLRCFQR